MKNHSRRTVLKAACAAGALTLMNIPSASNAKAVATVDLDKLPDIVVQRFGPMSCAQALATTYAELVGLSEEQAKNLAAGFGLGMGKKETCGALTVSLMISGLAEKGSICTDLMNLFAKEMGSDQCAFFVNQFGYSKCPDLLRFASRQLNERVFG